jgi:hypothetical protein
MVNPLDLDFETCWGMVNAEDKTAPAVVTTPDDIDHLCVDLEDNSVDAVAFYSLIDDRTFDRAPSP